MKPTGPAAVQDVAVVVEPLNVRRGGRGRGRKGATAKETAQVQSHSIIVQA